MQSRIVPGTRSAHATIRAPFHTPIAIVLRAADRVLLAANRWILIALLGAMAIIVFANVALRFTTDHSILWAEEVSRYLMIWLTFLGTGIVLRYGAHVAIDTLQSRWPGLAPALRAFVVTVLFVFGAAMVWLGLRYASLTWSQTTPVLGIPIGAVYLAMPIGFALMIAHLVLMATEFVPRGRFLAAPESGTGTAPP